jgi:hypothetical protein
VRPLYNAGAVERNAFGRSHWEMPAMKKSDLGISDALYDYLLDVSLREADVLRRLREETARMPDARMQIAPDQGQFMALLVELTGARRTLEVGVFTGYSSLAVALALPADGRIVACDVTEEWTAIARRYWAEAGVADKIDLRLAPALDTLDALIHRRRQARVRRLLRAHAGASAPRRSRLRRQRAVERQSRQPCRQRRRHARHPRLQREARGRRAHQPQPALDRRRADAGEEAMKKCRPRPGIAPRRKQKVRY